ncbi:MAG: EAL domain-containing protein [Betaproteobacteria bacterium]|nr:EAL domain-containing protein [Betaproteobacteria bacterium]
MTTAVRPKRPRSLLRTLRRPFVLYPLSVTMPVVLLLSTAVIGWEVFDDYIRHANWHIESERALEIRDDLGVVRTIVEPLVQQGRMDEAAGAIAALRSQRRLQAAYLALPDGVIVAATRPGDVGRPILDRLDLAETRVLREIVLAGKPRPEVVLDDGRSLLSGLSPVRFGFAGGQTGVLYVRYDLTQTKLWPKDVVLHAAGEYGAYFAVAVALLALFLYLVVMRRAARIMAASERFARGDTDTRCDVSGGDELGRLGTVLNRVAEEISRNQHLLRESEERYRLMAENASDMIARRAPDGTFTYVSAAARRLLGYGPEQLLGHASEDLVHPDDSGAAREADEAVLRFPGVYTAQFRMRRRDGHFLWAEATHKAIRGADGRVTEIVSVYRPVTEHKVHCAILTLGQGGTMHHAAAPSLPQGFIEEFDGMALGVDAGLFATLADQDNLGRAIDLAAHPRWLDYQALAARHGLHGCFYAPILSDSGSILGCIAAYYRGTLEPGPGDLTVVERAANFARIAVERDRARRALEAKERRFHSLIAQSRDMISVVDAEGLVSYQSSSVRTVLGHEPGFLEGRSLLELVHGDDALAVRAALRRVLVSREPQTVEFRCLSADRGWRIVESIGHLYQDEGRASIVLNTRDVTEVRDAEGSLRLAGTVFDSSSEGIMVTDASNTIVSVNRAFAEITGYQAEEVIGRNPRLLSSGRQDKSFYQGMWEAIRRDGQWTGEVWNRRKSGETYPEWLSISVVKDQKGQITHYVAIFSDITERKVAEQRIRHLAHYDGLTGLPNRNLLLDRLQQAVTQTRRTQKKVAVMFIDLDRFKEINDTLGHAFGDQVLQTAAERLSRCVRESDTVSRHGGDEFVIVLPDLKDNAGATVMAQKVITAVSYPMELDGREFRLTTSIGISVYPEDGEDPETLMKNADAAMYRVKELGNAFQFYTEDMNASGLERLKLEHSLSRAIEEEQFVLHYQPQVDLRSGQIVGVEVLLRWQHPELGLVSPAQFVPLAEETGHIVLLGEWALRRACRDLRELMDAGLPRFKIAVNLSARQFRQQDVLETVLAVLAETGLDPEWLELELTESIVMQNAQGTIETLQALKAAGIKLSIDDFGTGYSSLSYLKRFPIDKLKIDQSFVRDIATDPNDAAIVRAVVTLGHSLQYKVIAEGVETEEQVEFLRACGCDEAQGFHFSAPIPAEAIARLVRESGGRPVIAA